MSRHADETVLDNPSWHSLTGAHAHLALGGGLARRYPGDLAPVAGLARAHSAAFADLLSLVDDDETLFMLGVEPPLPSTWVVRRQVVMVQMTSDGRERGGLQGLEFAQLGEADVPDMLALTSMTEVGPFRKQTYRLGTYLGIRVQGELVSMAGEFLHPPGYHEIHVVCTHPDFRGRGYASELVIQLVNSNLELGLTPFLVTREDNVGAQSLYERLGFSVRRRIPMTAVGKESPE